jgi:hypothetical protein
MAHSLQDFTDIWRRSNMAHTGAPWKAQQIGPDYIMQGANHERVFSIRDGVIPMIPDRHLIEAAPELLEACKEIQTIIRELRLLDVTKRFSLCVADAAMGKAIAKATGEES